MAYGSIKNRLKATLLKRLSGLYDTNKEFKIRYI